ncbi:MAG: hypothetical protein PUA84_05120 [Oscillospiraceae bacterium]|nr:hypothetical protein [Oscillospiraceae bacterium]
MLFWIIEPVSSYIYFPVLYNKPVSADKLKPYLYSSVRPIISQHEREE